MRHTRDPRWPTVALLGKTLLLSALCRAPATAGASDGDQAGAESLVDRWLDISDAAKESQPHWMTPLVTVTPRLEQEYRYDESRQERPKSQDLTSYGGGKGLEVIPTPNTELIIGAPAYQTRTSAKAQVDGWADETLLLKYRFAAANEAQGNYIVTGFMGVSLPSGGSTFTNHDTIVTPTIAAGKGWGTREFGFAIQSTVGISIPTGDRRTLGIPTVWNTAFQGHVFEKLWPEIEASYTYFKDGPNDGKTQVALTAGVILGRFELTHRVKLIVGGGYQKPVSPFYTFNHTWLMTARATF